MRKLTALFASLLLLTGCSSAGNSSAEEEATARVVPQSCEIADVVAAFDQQVEGSAYVPTEWQPSEGTDLATALDAGGIACSYGIQVAEVGGTILWAKIDDETWTSRTLEWQEYGQTAIDLAGVDEDAAFILQEGTSADEMHVWTINLLIDGIWIQIGATFLQTVDEASEIISAAISATEL